MDATVEDFRKMLKRFDLAFETFEGKESTTFEFELAQIDFHKNGRIVGMIDFPNANYFHVWEILPNSDDFESAVRKIQSTIADIPQPVSNRILNASKP